MDIWIWGYMGIQRILQISSNFRQIISVSHRYSLYKLIYIYIYLYTYISIAMFVVYYYFCSGGWGGARCCCIYSLYIYSLLAPKGDCPIGSLQGPHLFGDGRLTLPEVHRLAEELCLRDGIARPPPRAPPRAPHRAPHTELHTGIQGSTRGSTQGP